MKKFLTLLTILCGLSASAQFRSTNGLFGFQTAIQNTDVLLISRASGNTNYNVPASNIVSIPLLATTISNIAATNVSQGYALGATNIFNIITYNSFYVDGINGSDVTGDGSVGKPWKTLGKAGTNALDGSTIYVGPATYTQAVCRDNVIWQLADGVVITGSDMGNKGIINWCIGSENGAGWTNLVVRGQGVFTPSGEFLYAGVGPSPVLFADIECRAVYADLVLIYNVSAQPNFFRLANCFFDGSILFGDGFEAGTPDIRLENCNIYTNQVASEGPYLIKSCASKVAQTADTNEIGTWLIHANMNYLAAP